MSTPSDDYIYKKLKELYISRVKSKNFVLNMSVQEVLTELKKEICCCVTIPKEPKEVKLRKYRNKTKIDIKSLYCPCLEMENSKERKVDFIGQLPIEISQLILRELDSQSLLVAAQVSKQWKEVCKSDIMLRKQLKAHCRYRKKQARREKRRKMGWWINDLRFYVIYDDIDSLVIAVHTASREQSIDQFQMRCLYNRWWCDKKTIPGFPWL